VVAAAVLRQTLVYSKLLLLPLLLFLVLWIHPALQTGTRTLPKSMLYCCWKSDQPPQQLFLQLSLRDLRLLLLLLLLMLLLLSLHCCHDRM